MKLTILQTILKTLDGTPSHVQSRHQLGQSLVEMAFVTPLLLMMVVGVVEIGYYANNYLNLMEVTRIGARTGTVLVGDQSPLEWDDGASLHKNVLYHMGVQEYAGRSNDDTSPLPDPPPTRDNRYNLSEQARDCGVYDGFYEYIACSMLDSLDPIELKIGERPVTNQDGATENKDWIDDIVISVFALQAINNDDPLNWIADPLVYSRTHNFETGDTVGKYPKGPSVIVVGRYPTNANECNMGVVDGAESPLNGRMPFDFYNYGVQNRTRSIDGVVRDIELFQEDTGPEYQRGFVWTGQYKVEEKVENDMGAELDSVCWGSNFSIEEVEQRMNAYNFIPMDDTSDLDEERRLYLPSEGLVLVEMMWNHQLLLDMPFYDTLVKMFGDTQDIRIMVWAAFPVPTVEPNIVFDLR